MGPSHTKWVVMGLIPAFPAKSVLLPSLGTISRIDESLPPYLAGILPCKSVASFIMSGFTAEKNPKK